METYYDYQGIIDALKAEYIKVRDLKRTANAKKRQLNNAHSFVNRKGNEEAVLETRLTTAKQDALSRAENALESIDNSIEYDYFSQLSESSASLANIEAEIERLERMHEFGPDTWPGFTNSEMGSMNSLINVLTSAINEVKYVYESEIKTSSKFSSLNDEARVSVSTHTDEQVINTYDTLINDAKNVVETTRVHLSSFIDSVLEVQNSVNLVTNTAAGRASALASAKIDLADLLDSNATQSEIDQKEAEIEFLKEAVLGDARELKIQLSNLDLLYTQKYKEFAVYLEFMNNLSSDIANFSINSGLDFGLIGKERFDLEIQKSIREIFNEIIRIFDEKLGWTLTNEIKNNTNSVSDRMKSYRNLQIKNMRTDRLFYNNFGEVFSIVDGRPEFNRQIPAEVLQNFMSYFWQLHQIASPFIAHHKEFNKRRTVFIGFWNEFNYCYDRHINNISNYGSTITQRNQLYNPFVDKIDGVYVGTPEQESQLSNLRAQVWELNGDFVAKQKYKEAALVKLQLLRDTFPDFYAELDTLKATLDTTDEARVAAQTEYETLVGIANEADQVIQRGDFAEGTPEYDAAIIDRDTKVAAYETFSADVYGPAMDAFNEANTAYQSFISSSEPVDIVDLNLTPSTLLSAIDEVEYRTSLVDDAQVAWDALFAEIEPLQSQMTLQQPSLPVFIGALGDEFRIAEEYDMRDAAYMNLINSGINQLNTYKNLIPWRYFDVKSWKESNMDEATEEGVLQSLKQGLLNSDNIFTQYIDDLASYELNWDLAFKSMIYTGEIEYFIFGNGRIQETSQMWQYFNPEILTTWAHFNDQDYIPTIIKEGLRNYKGSAKLSFANKLIDYVNTGVFDKNGVFSPE